MHGANPFVEETPAPSAEGAPTISIAFPVHEEDHFAWSLERTKSKARPAVEALVGQIGELRATERQLKSELEKVHEEFTALRRPAALTPEETTSNVDDAVTVRDRLRDAQIDAMNARTDGVTVYLSLSR